MNRRDFMLSATAGAAAITLPAAASIMSPTATLQGLLPQVEAFPYEWVHLDAQGQVLAVHQARGVRHTQVIDDATSIELVVLGAAQAVLGAPRSEVGCSANECARRPVRSNTMAVGQTPVTQAQWAAVAALPAVARELVSHPSHVDAPSHPVECVSWSDATEFCARLSQLSGNDYRLPTEAEWEIACRGGSSSPFHSGATITAEHANYIGSEVYAREAGGTYRRSTTPVHTFLPNPFGLYDMHGNVWEWCADHWHDSHDGAPADARARIAAADSGLRVVRGGGWSDTPERLRSASRAGYAHAALNRTIGFRVAVTL